MLSALPLEGLVVTADALYTQEAVCRLIVERKGDYVLTVKGNQPKLCRELEGLFGDPLRSTVRHSESDVHGDRYECRSLETTDELNDYLDWPHVGQVGRLTRVVVRKGKERRESVFVLSSLSPERASPKRLLELNRGHWGIEDRLHWVRDVTFGEDKSQVRTDAAPQVMAALRNTTIGLLRRKGCTNIAAALRRNAARPKEALALIGCFPTGEN